MRYLHHMIQFLKDQSSCSMKFYSMKVTGKSKGSLTLCVLFLIVTAIPHIATNGLYRTQRKCSHCATATTSPASIQLIVSKSKSQLRIAQCERALKVCNQCSFRLRLPETVNVTEAILAIFLQQFCTKQ